MNSKLKNKVIVISGGTKGVGKAAALAFAREGAKVVIGGRDEQSAEKILAKIKEQGTDGIFVKTDLINVGDCKNLFINLSDFPDFDS